MGNGKQGEKGTKLFPNPVLGRKSPGRVGIAGANFSAPAVPLVRIDRKGAEVRNVQFVEKEEGPDQLKAMVMKISPGWGKKGGRVRSPDSNAGGKKKELVPGHKPTEAGPLKKEKKTKKWNKTVWVWF